LTPFTHLLDALAPSAGGFTGPAPADWGQGRAIFGGLITGHALRALRTQVAADRPLRSCLVSFVGPAAPGDLQVTARVLRAGRAMTQAEARVTQGGDVKATLVCAYGAARATRLRVPTAPAPAASHVDDGLPMPYIEGVVPRFIRGFDYRWDPTCLPFSGAAEPVIRGAARLRGADRVDEAGVLALLDAWPAPILPLATGPVPASTVTWMVDFVAAAPPQGWAGDGFWRFRSEVVGSDQGYADIAGRIWSPDGQLVAASRQLVAEFSGSERSG
jgi:acyl-CoA thioesterase